MNNKETLNLLDQKFINEINLKIISFLERPVHPTAKIIKDHLDEKEDIFEDLKDLCFAWEDAMERYPDQADESLRYDYYINIIVKMWRGDHDLP